MEVGGLELSPVAWEVHCRESKSLPIEEPNGVRTILPQARCRNHCVSSLSPVADRSHVTCQSLREGLVAQCQADFPIGSGYLDELSFADEGGNLGGNI
jgi:hypothetical protein